MTLPDPHEGVRFMFVGRHERRKGLQELLAAIRLLPARGWTLDVVGPIPPDRRLNHPRVRFVGPLSDPKRILEAYDSADCLVCPSYAEGMPTVILEAMARGLATIATDVGAVAEVVSDANGILIPSPSPSLIAGAMERILSAKPEELALMRGAALEKARRYSWQQLGSRLMDSIRHRVVPC